MQTRLLQIWLRAIVTVGACALAPACVVEDRNFDEEFAQQQSDTNDAADSDTTTDETEEPSQLCQDYCERSEAVCTGDFEIFRDNASCLPLCSKMVAGTTEEPANTVMCRYDQLVSAISEADDGCPGASIASKVCGSPCQAYCQLHPQICGSVKSEATFETEECERQCAAVPSTPFFSVEDNYLDDSIQCRLIHLSTAALSEGAAQSHCSHARLASPDKCGADMPANCENYCKTVEVACTGELAQYASKETCLKTCAALPIGMMADRDQNTIGCRHYHAYTALSTPDAHCSHAGPTTDGHCGSPDSANCEAYCTLANAACEPEFLEKYETTEECMTECATLPGSALDSEYPPLPPDAGQAQVVQYLILAATKVIGDETGASCDDVFEPNFALRL